MARRVNSRAVETTESSFSLKKEVMAWFYLLLGAFYFLCLFSYTPRDPSFVTSAGGVAGVANLGGVVGSYLAGGIFFLFGGASYFIGLYFLINAVLFFSDKRSDVRILDFIVYLICAVFIAVFLQLYVGEFNIGTDPVDAGGTIGKLLSDIGVAYLGRWGVSLIVLFGTCVTFVLATKLSLVETINSSTVVIGRGIGSLGGQFFVLLARSRKRAGQFLKASYLVFKKLLVNFFQLFRKRARAEETTAPLPAVQPARVARAQPKPLERSSEPEEKPAFDKKSSPLPPLEPVGEPQIAKRKAGKPVAEPRQLELAAVNEDYKLPTLEFLDHELTKEIVIDEASLKMSARILEKKLKDFAIDGQVTEIHPGPVITMYEFQPAPGVKLSRIHSLTDDLSLAMGGRPVRIVAPLPNKAAVGIEIPNHERETVWLKDIIADERFQNHESRLVFALGKDIEGVPYVSDLKKMPHLLVAGATGSGKSVAVNSMICSMLYKARPDEVRMIMIDPKMIELSIYEGIPHLLLPVVTDPKKANLALRWAVREMERRYQLLSDVNARNLANYNRKIELGEIPIGEPKEVINDDGEGPAVARIVHEGKLPYIVVIVDEFADLMMVASKEVENSVCRLAQKARAAGIHVILATQRPSVDVITGIIKANFPSRIAFKVTSKHDARTIMDGNGAEHLLGMGDMLFMPPGTSGQTRLHGAYVTEKEIQEIVTFLKKQAKPVYHEEILTSVENTSEDGGDGENAGEADELYDQAVREVTDNGRVSISSVQRRFRIGYNRAARLVEEMEKQGIVSSPNSQGQRQVLAERA